MTERPTEHPPRRRLLVASITLVAGAALGAFAWLYSRPVVDEQDRAIIRSRLTALLAREQSAGTSGPFFECDILALAPTVGSPPPIPPPEELGAVAQCADFMRTSWDHELVDPRVSSALVVYGHDALVDRAIAADAPVRHLEVTLQAMWVLDGIVRAGRADLFDGDQLGLRWVSQTSLDRVRALSPEEAAHALAMLARVRAHHVSRLVRPELLLFDDALFDDGVLTAPIGVAGGDLEDAWWLCAERRVALAERVADLGCASSSTRVCYERLVAESVAVAALEDQVPPAWAVVLPPRARARHWTQCVWLASQLHARSVEAVAAEMAASLFDEQIAIDAESTPMSAVLSGAVPTFEGEPLRLYRHGDEALMVGGPPWLDRPPFVALRF